MDGLNRSLWVFPFSLWEADTVGKHFKPVSISRSTPMKHMHELHNVAEVRIFITLRTNFTLIFERWSTSDIRYDAIIASLPAKNANGYETVLLVCPTLENEDTLTAEHINCE